jgi:hypothetical protein
VLHEIERVLERLHARLRAETGGVERRGGLRETHDGFGIEALAEGDGEAGIESIATAAGAFDRNIEGRNLKTFPLGIMVIGAVTAPREDAGPDAAIDEEFCIVGKAGKTGEGRCLLDRGHEIIDMRQNLRHGRQVGLGAGEDIKRRRGAIRLGRFHQFGIAALVHFLGEADAANMDDARIDHLTEQRVIHEEITGRALHMEGRARAVGARRHDRG